MYLIEVYVYYVACSAAAGLLRAIGRCSLRGAPGKILQVVTGTQMVTQAAMPHSCSCSRRRRTADARARRIRPIGLMPVKPSLLQSC
jgi:hypothetical protein